MIADLHKIVPITPMIASMIPWDGVSGGILLFQVAGSRLPPDSVDVLCSYQCTFSHTAGHKFPFEASATAILAALYAYATTTYFSWQRQLNEKIDVDPCVRQCDHQPDKLSPEIAREKRDNGHKHLCPKDSQKPTCITATDWPRLSKKRETGRMDIAEMPGTEIHQLHRTHK